MSFQEEHPWPPSRRSVVRGAALASGGALLGGAHLLGTAPAALADSGRAAVAAPTVHTRSAWKARSPVRAAQVLARKPDHIVVHHTASANSTDYSQAHAFALSRSIQSFHMDGNGWDDTGQQLTISRGGHVMEGRNRSLTAINNGQHCVGAHTANENDHTIGIENEGLYTSARPTTALVNALVATLAWLCDRYGLDPQAAIVGHRDYNATACPGNVLYGMLPDLRDRVSDTLAARGVEVDAGLIARLPGDHLPTYPEPPLKERAEQYWHGPALGSRDPGR